MQGQIVAPGGCQEGIACGCVASQHPFEGDAQGVHQVRVDQFNQASVGQRKPE
jgi:hypothetical protein